MKKLLISLIVPGLLLIPAAGLAATETPTVDSIIAKAIAATGGEAAMKKVNSRVLKASLISPMMGPNSSLEVVAKAPDKQWSKVNLGDMGSVMEGFDGKIAWAQTPWDGVRVKEGDELQKVKRDAQFHKETQLKAIYPDLTYKGTEKVGEANAHVLESKPTATSRERFYFDTSSGRLVRQTSTYQTPSGEVTAVMDLADYRPVDQVQYPHKVKVSVKTGEQDFSFEMNVTEVKHNQTIPDTKFAKPAA